MLHSKCSWPVFPSRQTTWKQIFDVRFGNHEEWFGKHKQLFNLSLLTVRRDFGFCIHRFIYQTLSDEQQKVPQCYLIQIQVI